MKKLSEFKVFRDNVNFMVSKLSWDKKAVALLYRFSRDIEFKLDHFTRNKGIREKTKETFEYNS